MIKRSEYLLIVNLARNGKDFQMVLIAQSFYLMQ